MTLLSSEEVRALATNLSAQDLSGEPVLQALLSRLQPEVACLQDAPVPMPSITESVFALDNANPHARRKLATLNFQKRKMAALDVGASDGHGGPNVAGYEEVRGAKKYKKPKAGRSAQANQDNTIQHHWIVSDQPFLPDDPKALALLQKLAQGSESNVESQRCREWVDRLHHITHGIPWRDATAPYTTDGLGAIIERCRRSMAMLGAADFVSMINLVQFIVKVDRYVNAKCSSTCYTVLTQQCSIKKSHNLDREDIHKHFVAKLPNPPHIRTFRLWLSQGQKYAVLAAAGEWTISSCIICF